MEEKLPEGWVLARIGDIADVIGGSTPLRSENRYFGGDIVWLTPTEIPKGTVSSISTSKEKLTWEGFNASGVHWIPEGSVLLTSRASIGYVAIAGTQLTTNQGFASFVLPNEVDSKYFGWWLKSQKSVLEDLAGGTTFKEISKTTLKEIFAPIAPLPEQHRIVAAIEQQFTRLDNAIASLQSARARIKQYRASLLKSAVEGELTRQWRAAHPAQETGEQLLKRILAERRKRWEEEQLAKMREQPKDDKWKLKYKEPEGPDTTNLPELPEGWCWATVEQLADVIGGVTKGRDLKGRVTTILSYLRVANVQRGFLDLSVMKTIEIPEDEVEKYLLRPGDILLTEGGDADKLGRATVWRGEIEKCIHQNHVFRARLVEPNIPPLWLTFYVNSEQGRNYFLNAAKQTVNLASINLTQLRSCPVPLPPLTEQEQIVAEVEANLSNIARLEEATEHSLKRAEHERQSILREAFAGRLVPQDPHDEAASVLLERIREERKKREEAEKVVRAQRRGGNMGRARKRQAGQDGAGQQEIDLYQELVKAGRPLPPDDLFKRAGLRADEQPESVEIFYEALQADVEDNLIKETRPDDAHVLLEALEPPADATEDEETTTTTKMAQPETKQGDMQKVRAQTLWGDV